MEDKEQIIVVTNNCINANIDGQDFKMSMEQFNTLSTLVLAAKDSNMGTAYIDKKGLHVLQKKDMEHDSGTSV